MQEKKLSRRDFIRNSSLIAAGSVAGSVTGNASLPKKYQWLRDWEIV